MGITTRIEGDDVEVFRMIYDSGHECSRCQEKILFAEEVYVLWVVSACMNGEFQLRYAESEDGDFLYPPQFFCFSCWEECLEEFLALNEDVRPIYDEKGVLDCAFCDSSILLDEYFGQTNLGEIRCSEKTPNGEVAYHFHSLENSEPPTICISCLKLLNDEVVAMWEEGVDQEGECDEGTHLRCWRITCTENCEEGDCALVTREGLR